MRVLIACEFSGTVRTAFTAMGHDAWSCDLLPTERPGQHIVGDVLDVLGDGWDLMVAHPPCTHLAVSGARWFKDKQVEQAEALQFVRDLLGAPIPRIALENPISIISSRIRKPDQIVQPWQFGHSETKATCLWLKGLPLLVADSVVSPRPQPPLLPFEPPLRVLPGRWDNETLNGQNKIGPAPVRWKLRSRTYPGIAAAMAAQWPGDRETGEGARA